MVTEIEIGYREIMEEVPKNKFENGTYIKQFSPKTQTNPQMISGVEQTNIKFTQGNMEITDQNCVNSEVSSVNINVREKDYLFSKNSLFVKYYISCMITFFMMVILFISPFRFPTQKPLKMLVNKTFQVNFTKKVHLPVEIFRQEYHFTEEYNRITNKMHFAVFPVVILSYSTRRALCRIDHIIYSLVRRIQQIIFHMSHQICLQSIRYGNSPFGRLKMF